MFQQVYRQVRDNGIFFQLGSDTMVNSWLASEAVTAPYGAFSNYGADADAPCLPLIFQEGFGDRQPSWAPYHEATTGLTHLRQVNDASQLVYACFSIVSTCDAKVLVNLYNKKNVKIWFNGSLVYCGKSNMKCLDDSFILPVTKGDNFVFIEKNALSISLKIQEYQKELEVRRKYLSDLMVARYETGINVVTDSYVCQGGELSVLALAANPAAITDGGIQLDLSGSDGLLLQRSYARIGERVRVGLDASFAGKLTLTVTTRDGKSRGEAEIFCGDINEELDKLKAGVLKSGCEAGVKNDLLAQIHEAWDIYNLQETTAYESRMMFEEELKTLLAHLAFLKKALAELESGSYLHEERKGVLVNSYPSRLDDRPQHYYAFIPPQYDGTDNYPVVVILKYLYKKVQIPGFAYLAGAEAPGFITISPAGRGMNRYEVAGEVDLLEALDDLARRYRIDRRRIYLMGFSMGGGACWNLAQKYPGIFCGVVTLSSNMNKGYQVNLTNTSIVSIAGELDRMVDGEGNHADICQFRDTHGLPQVSSLLLENTNHFALYNVYNDTKMFQWLAQCGSPDVPLSVHFKTDNLRHNTSHWIAITDVFKPSRDSEIAARILGDTLSVRAENVREFQLDPGAIELKGIRYVDVGGEKLSVGAVSTGTALGIRIDAKGGARVVAESSLGPNSNLCGLGMTEIYYGRACVVSCTQQDEGAARMIKKLASSFSRPIYYAGYREKYCDIPVCDADQLPAGVRSEHLIAIGGPEDHFLMDLFAQETPSRILAGIYSEIGKEQILGMMVKVPSSYASGRRALVISIADAAGIAKYKDLDIFKATFSPALTGGRDLMRSDAVIFTGNGVKTINYDVNWGIEEVLDW